MKITIESTARIVTVNQNIAEGLPCRVWEGVTERGIKVQCLIPRIAALATQDLSQFVAELEEQSAPSADVQAFPLRMIL
jgi:hypothetical protein